MMVDYSDMVATLAKDGELIRSEMTAENAHLLHMSVGISGEVGELLLAIRNYSIYGMDMDKENIVEELGDTEFYREGLQQSLFIADVEIEGQRHFDCIVSGNALEATVGLSISASEILDTVKKAVIYQKQLDTDKLVKDLVLLAFHMEEIRGFFGIFRSETLDANIAKLSVRYNGLKYSDSSAQARADKKQGN